MVERNPGSILARHAAVLTVLLSPQKTDRQYPAEASRKNQFL